MGQCSFLLTVLAFRCPLSVYSQIDIGCGIKIVAVFVSAKNTLSRHQPTNPDPGSVSTTSVQNKQPPAPNASNQNNQSTQTGVKKFSSPKRTPTRHSAAKDLSVWRQACFIMALITGLTQKIMIHVLSGLKTSVGVYKGKGQQGAVEYSIQSFKWKPATCAKTHTLRNSKKHLK